jgi:Holliday junction resolvase RusA-like endonuclease
MSIHRIGFIVPGEPVAKARVRADGRGAKARVYTPTETVHYEREVGRIATVARVEEFSADLWPMQAASYYVGMNIFIKRRNPDADNVAKSIVDGMIGALFDDDKRVGCFFPPPRRDASPRVEVVVLAFRHHPWVAEDQAEVSQEAISVLCSRVSRAVGPAQALLIRELRAVLTGEFR